MNRKHYKPLARYTFVAEDEFGDYDNGKPRKGHINKDGYVRTNYLCEDGKWHLIFEHVAKWEYFNGMIPNDMEIDHIKPISEGGTNKLSNLRCVTRLENNNNPNTRVNNSKSKINGKKSRAVDQIKEDGEVIRWVSISEAVRNGYSHNCIILCCQGKRDYHRGCRWKYASAV